MIEPVGPVIELARRLSPVGGAALSSLLDDVAAVEQVSPAFVLVGAWWSRGADPASTPAVLDSGLSQFWFATTGPDGAEAVFVWHDYSLLDQSIELSVAFLEEPDGDRWAPIHEALRCQCDHVRRSVHLRRVVTRTIWGAGAPHPVFEPDGMVPRMITDHRGRCHDVDYYSASPQDIAGGPP